MNRSARRRVVTVVGAVALAVITLTGAATAATWDFYRRSAGLNSGGGDTAGTMTFGTSGTSLAFNGRTQDVCPPDGLGTSYYILMDITGSDAYRYSGYKAIDGNGCGNGWTSYEGGNMNTTGGRKIVSAQAVMCFTNDGNPCWVVPDPGAIKDNPYYP